MMVREMRPGPAETPLMVLEVVVTCASASVEQPSAATPTRARTRAQRLPKDVEANAVAADADMANPPYRVSSIIGAVPGGFPPVRKKRCGRGASLPTRANRGRSGNAVTTV